MNNGDVCVVHTVELTKRVTQNSVTLLVRVSFSSVITPPLSEHLLSRPWARYRMFRNSKTLQELPPLDD